MRRALLGIALLGAGACAHLTPFTPRALAGQTFPIRPGWSMALAIDGSVSGRPAVVWLAVEEPLSRVTEVCFESPPEVVSRVDTGAVNIGRPDAGPGARAAFQEQVMAGAVHLGDRLLGDVRALRDSGSRCELTLGSEVLIGFVLEVRPGARTVTFHGQAPTAPAFQSEDSVVLELTRDPRTDRPSLAVQLQAEGSPLTVPMVLATASASVEVSADAGKALAGKDVRGRSLAPKSLALAPDWSLRQVEVAVVGPALPGDGAVSSDDPLPTSTPGLSGVLGADAWGHYRVLIDLRGQTLVLYRRPLPVEGQSGAESWIHISSDRAANGTRVRLISWQMLDHGGRVPLEPSRVQLKSCRIGLTLGPEDPGASLEVAVPWTALEKELPACAAELATIPAWSGELVESGARPCSGTCVYAQDVASGRTVCTCSARRAGEVTPATRPATTPPSTPEEPEPADPAIPRARKPAQQH